MWRFVYMLIILLCCLAPGTGEASAYSERIAAMAEIKAVRIAPASDHVRIVLDTTKEVDYHTFFLNAPSRLVVDIKGAWIGQSINRETILDNPFVSKVRIGQHDQDTVRLVIEYTVSKDNMRLFSLAGGNAGHRVVLDFGNQSVNGGGTSEQPNGSKQDEAKPEPVAEDNKPPQPVVDKTGEANVPEKEEADDQQEVVPPKGLKGKKIVIDPGHGGEDSGAIGPSGVMEKSITLQIAQLVQSMLEDADAEVIMTRDTDTEVSPKHRQATDIDELQARCDVANKAKANLFISIHMDSFTNKVARGTTGYYYAKGTAQSKKLATAVQKNLINRLGTDSRGVKTCNFYVVKHTTMPATLIEVAFISNPAEEKLLTSSAGVKKAAKGIFEGIAEFFSK